MVLGTIARREVAAEVCELASHLGTRYRPDPRGRTFPPLLWSLDHTRVLTSPRAEPGGGHRSPPGSRPPADIDWPSTADVIRRQVTAWDAYLRGSEILRDPVTALGALGVNAELAPDPDLRRLRTDARKWVRSAAILLGYLDPRLDVPQLYRGPCFDCGEQQVHLVPLATMGECYACGAEYSALRVRALVLAYYAGTP